MNQPNCFLTVSSKFGDSRSWFGRLQTQKHIHGSSPHRRKSLYSAYKRQSPEEALTAKLGFVGLGVMGSRMARRLLTAHHTVTGYNRTRDKAHPLVEAGMNWADSPRLVTESSDVVFSMIANNDALRAVTEGQDGIIAGLSRGKIYVEMSTVSPAAIRQLAEKVESKHAEMVDAPVSGSSVTLDEGKLSFMVGGKKEIFDKVLPYLQAIGPKATYVGGHGLAASMKIATNLSLAVQMLAFSEGLLLAEKSGITRDGRRSASQQRHRLADGEISRPVCIEDA